MIKKVLILVAGSLVAVGVIGFLLFNKDTQANKDAIAAVNAQNQAEIMAPVPLSAESVDSSTTGVAKVMATDTVAEVLVKKSAKQATAGSPVEGSTKLALLADGCFWCVEHDLEEVTGVVSVVSGYAGGTGDAPTYQNYVAGGYKEVVLVTYNPAQVSYANLVEHIIKHGDPTDTQGSFHDRGPQYAPAIYYQNDSEKAEANRVIKAVDAMHVFANPLQLAVLPTVTFYLAEDYHQDYAKKNPLKYSYYRTGSGRTAYIEKTWGDKLSVFEVPSASVNADAQLINKEVKQFSAMSWDTFVKPSETELKAKLTATQFNVTQQQGTESPHTNAYDKNWVEGIYVDIVSGEPLYFSKDKFDSGTGWPSFVKPISADVITLKEDNGFFSKRTEVRSKHADSHVGHVFDDGPADRGGKRYCMNSAAMRFIAKADLEKEGYGYLVTQI